VISIKAEWCTGCGLCVSVCKDFSLELKDKKVIESENPLFGCIGCGHCMAICPTSAIQISGRTISPDSLFDLNSKEKGSDFEQIFTLFQSRRSMREFSSKDVNQTLIDKIINASSTAPMGLPPSDVNILIFKGVEKNRQFAIDFCTYLENMKWLVSGWFLSLMKPIWGKVNDSLFRNFVKPLFSIYRENMKQGINLINYDAPLAMYFYGTPYCDPADPIVAATYAMTAAESLGLATCMIGAVHPLIQNGKKARKFRIDQGIRHKSREGLFVLFGYPAVHYSRGITRTFASVDYR
jgi:ferredoxin